MAVAERGKQYINDAVYYLEIRHKLVHTDGYADEEFKKTHPRLRYTNKREKGRERNGREKIKWYSYRNI